MADNFVPEHLLKDELRFEVAVRGVDAAGDVMSMRSQLRGLFRDRAEPEWRESMNLEKELGLCRTKVEEWDEMAEVFTSEPPVGPALVRTESRLLHWLRRLRLLASADLMGAGDLAWIVEAKGRIQSLLDSLSGGVKALAKETPPSTSSEVPVLVSLPSGVSQTPPAHFPAPVPNLPPPVLPLSSPVPHSPFPAAPVTALVDGGFASRLPTFHKLPNPLTPLLQSLPVVDGLDVNLLLSFLGIVFRIREVPGMRDYDLLSLILPYCRSPLADRLTAALAASYDFDRFHSDVLDFFVPSSMRERLKMDLVFRPQRFGEPLPEFVAAVKQARRVLRLFLSEFETVQIILDGINPEERSRLVFAGRPSSFLELDRLCVTARSVQFLDQQRGQASAPVLSTGPVMSVQEGPQNSPRTFVPTCFGCGQRGHIRRFCRRSNFGNNSDSGPKNGGQGGPSPR